MNYYGVWSSVAWWHGRAYPLCITAMRPRMLSIS